MLRLWLPLILSCLGWAGDVEYYRNTCDKGDAMGCNNLGVMYLKGQGVTKDASKALELYHKACDLGSSPGCFNLGVIYQKGLLGIKDGSKALEFYRKACDLGERAGCTSLGDLYLDGKGVAKDEAKAADLYRKACDLGEKFGCGYLGLRYRDGRGVTKDQSKASEYFRKACDLGDGKGCANLGQMYQDGEGVAKNEEKAAELCRQGCDMGEAMGCGNLGVMYRNGQGVAKDEAKAVEFYRKSMELDRKACIMGDGWGCSSLGDIYRNGLFVGKDVTKAVEFYRNACDLGIGWACNNLGWMYQDGQNIAKDESKAFEFFQKACDLGEGCIELGKRFRAQDLVKSAEIFRKACGLGDGAGCEWLGMSYQNGEGVVQDWRQAEEFYRKACDLGDKPACLKQVLQSSQGSHFSWKQAIDEKESQARELTAVKESSYQDEASQSRWSRARGRILYGALGFVVIMLGVVGYRFLPESAGKSSETEVAAEPIQQPSSVGDRQKAELDLNALLKKTPQTSRDYEEHARAYVRSGKTLQFLESAGGLLQNVRSSYSRAFLRAGDYDTAYELLKNNYNPVGWEAAALPALRKVISHRRGGTLFAGQQEYSERLELAMAFSKGGLKEEILGLLTEKTLESASREETDSYLVAQALDEGGVVGDFVQQTETGRRPGFYSAFANAFSMRGRYEAGLALLDKKEKPSWDRDDYSLFIGMHGKLGTIPAVKPETIPEEHRVLLAEAILEADQDDAAWALLQGIPRKIWRAREYGVGLRLCQRLELYPEAKIFYQEIVARIPLSQSPDQRYYYAILCEKLGQFGQAKGIYEELLKGLGGYKDAARRLKNLEAIPAEDISRISLVATTAAIRKSSVKGMPAAPAAPGAMPVLIAGRFEILASLGVGGMGVVYKAHDRKLNRDVAVKKMLGGLAKDPKWKNRFLDEAKTVGELRHPGIVELQDVVESEGSCYLVFECVDGETLEEIVASRGRMAPGECAAILKAICAALHHAHGRGVIHLDIKPSNIMRDKSGTIKVLDFGLARHIGQGDASQGKPETSGTPAYMSPEQHEGHPAIGSDLYSLGVTLYELLSGTLPFRADGAERLYEAKTLESYPPLPQDIPSYLRDAAAWCLKADAAKRPQNIRDLLKSLTAERSLGLKMSSSAAT